MESQKTKKCLAFVLALIMLFTMIPTTVFTLATDESLPVIKKYTGITVSNKPDHHSYRENIVTATFTDCIDLSEAVLYWDVSASADTGTVMSWLEINSEETQAAGGTERYDLYIGGEGGVQANPVSTNFFYSFTSLKEVRGLEKFHTSGVTTFDCFFEECSSLTALDLRSFNTSSCTNFSYMFSGCKSLVSVNLKGWDTSAATNMGFMFANCWVLPELDISSFNTKKVTYMKRMFYKCEKLTTLYMGDDWSVDQVSESNSGEMFNCCYAVKGQKSFDEVPAPYNKQYANTDYFLTYKAPEAPEEYKVTYEFIGDVPDGLAPPSEAKYEEGSTVTVAAPPEADGYIFSGWTTEDAEVSDNSFTVNNDVHFVGSFEKLYRVEYRYTEGYDIPEGAPELPEAVYYTAGEWVDLFGVPYVERYLFIGWATDDTDVAGDMFIMPENDVTLYGYFKIPVESIEFMTDEEDVVINEGEKIRLNVYIKPEDATVKSVIYESSDPDVVTVDKYGNITAVGEGTATVTVKSADDETKSDTITVTVKVPATEITVDKTEITLKTDGKDKITGTVNPEATNQKVNYKSNDESVVKVDENGNIEAVGAGTATVTVYSDDDPTVKKEVTVTVKNPVTEITVENKEIIIDIDNIIQLNAKVNDDATNKELIYESSDPGVVKTDSMGEIIAVGKGEAIVTITSKDNPNITETVKVTVNVPADGITVDKEEITLTEGETDKITASVTPDDATEKGVTYESSDESVVKVDENGNITAVGEGTAVITVISKDDPSVTAKVSVTVDPVNVPADGITVDREEITLTEGETDKITASVTPDDATEKGVTYKSSDESVVKVDENGNITAVGAGEAVITVTAKGNPSLSVEIPVSITAPQEPEIPTEPEKIPVTDVTVDKSDIILEEGQSDKITASVTPDNATEKGVTYKSSDESVVKVDENGNITAVGAGEATVLVISKDDPTKAATVFVTVKPVNVPVDSITVDKEEITLTKGETDKITVSVTPDNATEKGVIYESGDESIVKTDKNGNITAVGVGETFVTVISKDDPTKKTTVKITVEKPVYTVETPDSVTMYKGETTHIGTVITPDDGTIVPVYTSSDESVVKIDADGNLKAVGVGIAVITADFGGGDIRLIPVTVLTVPVKHHVCFGKTDGIGWYEVSVNGGDFFPQGPNSTLEVEEGSVLVVRVQDMWIDDEFDFYVNGKKVPLDPANTITVVVDGYMLIGALSMDVPVPDVDESLSLLDKLLKSITDFFAKIKEWFSNLFG